LIAYLWLQPKLVASWSSHFGSSAIQLPAADCDHMARWLSYVVVFRADPIHICARSTNQIRTSKKHSREKNVMMAPAKAGVALIMAQEKVLEHPLVRANGSLKESKLLTLLSCSKGNSVGMIGCFFDWCLWWKSQGVSHGCDQESGHCGRNHLSCWGRSRWDHAPPAAVVQCWDEQSVQDLWSDYSQPSHDCLADFWPQVCCSWLGVVVLLELPELPPCCPESPSLLVYISTDEG